MIAALGAMMLVPMLIDLAYQDTSWPTFMISSVLVSLLGAVLALSAYTPKPRLTPRATFLLTALSWVCLSFVAAIPFIMQPLGLSVTDAVFEATSGISTTGATILTGLDELPKGILMWRAILQWIGGVGIIVTALAFLPMLKVGGMQLFRLESSDVGEKILPRAASIASAIGTIYLVLTLACTTGYILTGMNGFDAVAHAMTTVATGGFSTSDASMGGFMEGGSDVVAILFMTLGAMPFGVYMLMAQRKFRSSLLDPQVRAFLMTITAFSVTVAGLYWLSADVEFLRALRLSTFNSISIITGTGYATADYQLWGPFAVAFFFAFMFIGGCAGSTACSVKIFRYQVAFEALRSYIFRMPRQHALAPMRYGGKPLPEPVVYSVLAFFFLFFLSFAVTAMTLSLLGLDPVTAWSGAGSAIANVGPGLGDIIGPAGTYAPLPDSAKWVLLTAMIVGRLEIVTALVILSPAFWRS
jgi:trk system potassium uptake protein TrkH